MATTSMFFPSIESHTSVYLDDYSQSLRITGSTATTLDATNIYDNIVQTTLNLQGWAVRNLPDMKTTNKFIAVIHYGGDISKLHLNIHIATMGAATDTSCVQNWTVYDMNTNGAGSYFVTIAVNEAAMMDHYCTNPEILEAQLGDILSKFYCFSDYMLNVSLNNSVSLGANSHHGDDYNVIITAYGT